MKLMRAWANRLDQLNGFANYLDEKGFLNKGESNEKATIFRAYYRFYNDGDYPHGYKFQSRQVVQEYLENRLEKFMKKIIKKNMTPAIRTGVRRAKLKDTIDTITTYTTVDSTSPTMVAVFAKKLPISARNAISDPLVAMNVRFRDLTVITNTACNAHEWEKSYHNPANNVMLYKRKKMKEAGIWDQMMEDTLVGVIGECAKIEFILKNQL